jgi:2-C-methyl-D-erythritol 4-phosphate cytidylyltransferase
VENVSVILLAGGVGSRMKAGMPKQFMELRGKPVLQHTLDLFLGLECVSEVVLVISQEYRQQQFDIFAASSSAAGGGGGGGGGGGTRWVVSSKLKFADPGVERQDSVLNGLEASCSSAPVVCIHDAARPLVTHEEIYQVEGFYLFCFVAFVKPFCCTPPAHSSSRPLLVGGQQQQQTIYSAHSCANGSDSLSSF